MVQRMSVSHAAPWMVAASLLTLGSALAGPKPKDWEPVVDPGNFVLTVDNPYFPLVPGRTMLYRSDTRSGTETLQIEVMNHTQMILGVPTTVVIETAALNGTTIEIAENWFAQDHEGNVWYFGESTQEFTPGGPVSTHGSWVAGAEGARPGIIMKAHPTPGDTYFQEFAPGVAQDMASVISVNRTETVPYGSYSSVLETKEWTPLAANSVEHKSYAPGLGLILEEKGGERMRLVAVR